MVRQIAEVYIQKTDESIDFKAKTDRLTVIPFDVPVSKPYAVFKATWQPIGIYNYSMVIVYNSVKFNPMYTAHAIAYEFGHLLMFNPVDCLHNIEIVVDLEEAIADYLAYYILSNMHYADKSGSYKNRCDMELTQNKRRVIEELEKHFGKPLLDCKKIDELNAKNKKANICRYNVVTFNRANTKELL